MFLLFTQFPHFILWRHSRLSDRYPPFCLTTLVQNRSERQGTVLLNTLTEECSGVQHSDVEPASDVCRILYFTWLKCLYKAQ